MDQQRYQHIKQIIARALELPPLDRLAHLEQACGEDRSLLREAQQLLEHDRSEPGEIALIGTPPLADLSGTTIGPYRIVTLLGEGGMGEVYLADQLAPLRRQVALKVIKIGMDTREVIARFASERQALALMDHPNIARVLDAGATASGRPYFVMEHIPGIALTRYCRERGLDLRARLDLFLQVCRGVHHAHQKGVIHRDLKPSNIIVSEIEGRPVPRIIDFGIAKATTPDTAGHTGLTQLGRLIGTPEYMSPEQADPADLDIDIRSDVFSLGVILYELLTDLLPIDRQELLRAGQEQIGTVIRTRVPPRPSTRLTTAGTDTRARRLRGDLDWITMKALEKDRDRRYESAAALADDLVRHLEHRVVEAGPPSRAYQLRKFVGRNRLTVTVGASLLVALVAFAGWQTAQSRIIARERDRALANERLSLAHGKITTDPTVALAYVLASLELLDQPTAREVARQAIAAGPIRDELPRWGQRGNPISVDASADGRHCAVSWSQTEQPTVGIYDLHDLTMRLLHADTRGIVYEVDFNADASILVGNGNDGLHAWRVADGAHLWHLPELAAYYSSRVFRLADPHAMAICANDIGEPTAWFSLDLRTGRLGELGRSRGVQAANGDAQLPAIDPSATWILDYDGSRLYRQRVDELQGDQAELIAVHEDQITAVALDPMGVLAASMDVAGRVKIWDLAASQPRLLREHHEKPGNYTVTMDPFDRRFVTTWGSAIAHLYDLADRPPRLPQRLLDRTFWVHDGTFLPDGSVITSRNWVASGPVAWWRHDEPVLWRLDIAGDSERNLNFATTRDGQTLLLWTRDGDILAEALTDRDQSGPGPGSLGRTCAPAPGTWFQFLVDDHARRCLTFCLSLGTQVLDLASGEARQVPDPVGRLYPLDMSAGGRLACFTDLTDNTWLHVGDLDSGEILVSHPHPGSGPPHVRMQADSLLVVLHADVIIARALLDPTAPPDTLWQGDASTGGILLDRGRAAVVRDRDHRLVWLDLTSGRQVTFGPTGRGRFFDADYQRDLGLFAVGGWWESIHVCDVRTGREWLLPAPAPGRRHTYRVRIDPEGRWIISQHPDQILAWRLPLDPLFGEPDHGELLELLRERTNVRVVPDPDELEGFRVTNSAMW